MIEASLDVWVIVIPDDRVLPGTVHTNRDRVTEACAAVCLLNHLKPNDVRIAPARLIVDLDAAVVWNEDPAYLATLKAVNMGNTRMTKGKRS